MDDILKFFGVMMTLMTVGLIGYTAIRVINRFPDRSRNRLADGLNPDELELVRRQLDEVEDLKTRVAELEERVDFSERLLAQQQPGTLPGPH